MLVFHTKCPGSIPGEDDILFISISHASINNKIIYPTLLGFRISLAAVDIMTVNPLLDIAFIVLAEHYSFIHKFNSRTAASTESEAWIRFRYVLGFGA